jgi:YidC/Oxa1 family membrane protein insertase
MIGASGVFFWWQPLLDGLGVVLQGIYSFIGNYGLAIILLTVGIRLILLPLGLKQIRSMHQMQAIQPKVKALQAKYKGNKQKLNEETMKLYREHGVSPLGGCWPMLLQIPVLAALYSVLQYPQHPPHLPCDEFGPRGDDGVVICVEEGNVRASIEEQLYVTGVAQDVNFLGMNLLCGASNAGTTKELTDAKIPEDAPEWQQKYRTYTLDCGGNIPSRIPYYVLAALMIGTTYYQSRQMQKANPAGGSSQQQTMTRIMPLLFGVWGYLFPAGLVLYWTTSNLWQIGQQHFVLKAKREAEAEGGPLVPPPTRRPRTPPPSARGGTRGSAGSGKSGGTNRAVPAKGTKKPASGSASSGTARPAKGSSGGGGGSKPPPPKPKQPTQAPRRGWLAGVIERAEQQRNARTGDGSGNGSADASSDGGTSGTGTQGSTSKGSSDGGDRKKRRKR